MVQGAPNHKARLRAAREDRRTAANRLAARRATAALALVVIATALFWSTAARADLFGRPNALKSRVEHIRFETPALAPLGHTRFCARYRHECEVRGVDFRKRNIKATDERLAELSSVNREVNREITPRRDDAGPLSDNWQIAPEAGDCEDYAVTKRHKLLARGWPSRSLLLAEVVIASGEHHLVLVVRKKDADFVLDNLNANVRPVAKTRYHWVRAQSPSNPKFWSTVSVPTEMRTATRSAGTGIRSGVK
jgi:predicted transglutaminase-like cysteine proteinase